MEKLLYYLKENKKIRSTCIVGSYLHCSKYNGIDMLITTNEDREWVKDYLRQKLDIDEFFACDDSISFSYDGTKYNIAIYSNSGLKTILDSIINNRIYGECREWCLGYWTPEGFLFDIKNAKILFDKGNLLVKYIQRIDYNFNPVIRLLKNRIIQEINLRAEITCEGLLNRANNLFISFAIMRLINIHSGWFLSNFKEIVKKINSLDEKTLFKLWKDLEISLDVYAFKKDMEVDRDQK